MTKKQEQAAEAATTPEITGETEAKTEHKTPCVYCGPSVRGVARQYTVYASGNTPAALDEFVKQHPAAKNLLVPVDALHRRARRWKRQARRKAFCTTRSKTNCKEEQPIWLHTNMAYTPANRPPV